MANALFESLYPIESNCYGPIDLATKNTDISYHYIDKAFQLQHIEENNFKSLKTLSVRFQSVKIPFLL